MAEIVFNPDTGLRLPSTQEIREDLKAKIEQAFQVKPDDPLINLEPSSPMGQVLDIVVAEIEAKNSELAYVTNMVNPNSANGKWLDAIAALYGIDRKSSEPSVVTCQLKGLPNTFIPYGVIVQDSQGNQYRHNAVAGVTLDSSGAGESTFSSIVHGAIEVAPHAITQIITSIAGWQTVDNELAAVVGRYQETNAELRERILESYAINSHGAVESIESSLRELAGVLDCRVLENFTGDRITEFGLELEPHSIGVCIVGGEDTDIAEVIYRKKDLGCGTTGDYEVSYVATDHNNAKYTYEITRPENKQLKIKITLYNEDLSTYQIEDLKETILDDFAGRLDNPRVGLAQTLYAARFYKIVEAVIEDSSIKSIELSLGEEDEWKNALEIKANEEPTLASEDIEIVYKGGEGG